MQILASLRPLINRSINQSIHLPIWNNLIVPSGSKLLFIPQLRIHAPPCSQVPSKWTLFVFLVTESWFSFRVDNFDLQLADVGEIKKIKIRHDNLGFMPAWDLAKVRQKRKNRYWIDLIELLSQNLLKKLINVELPLIIFRNITERAMHSKSYERWGITRTTFFGF